jgi:hypothetical protein
MQVFPTGQWRPIPARTLPLPGQNLGLPGPMQAPRTNTSQKVPPLQEWAPLQQTPPSGAQVNLFGQRKKPGLPGQGGPCTCVSCVPGGITMMVLGGTDVV